MARKRKSAPEPSPLDTAIETIIRGLLADGHEPEAVARQLAVDIDVVRGVQKGFALAGLAIPDAPDPLPCDEDVQEFDRLLREWNEIARLIP